VVGNWEVVTESSSTPDQDSTVGVKREREEELDPASQPWKLKSKIARVGLDEVYDPGIIPIRLKAENEEQGAPQIKAEESFREPGHMKWTNAWKPVEKREEVEPSLLSPPLVSEADTDDHVELTRPVIKGTPSTEDPVVKHEETETPPSKSLFRKRKTPFVKKS
jgi:WW domain-binding protein 4